jgi:hypothetical protein
MTAELQFRLPSRGTVLAAAVVLVWGVGGCSLLSPKPSTQTPIDDPESVNIGYVLFYDLVAKQKNTDKVGSKKFFHTKVTWLTRSSPIEFQPCEAVREGTY